MNITGAQKSADHHGGFQDGRRLLGSCHGVCAGRRSRIACSVRCVGATGVSPGSHGAGRYWRLDRRDHMNFRLPVFHRRYRALSGGDQLLVLGVLRRRDLRAFDDDRRIADVYHQPFALRGSFAERPMIVHVGEDVEIALGPVSVPRTLSAAMQYSGDDETRDNCPFVHFLRPPKTATAG